MNRLLLATAAALLAATALVPAPASATDVDPATAWDGCIQYMYIADYHWYWVCVDPKGGTCAVYFKDRHGMTYSKRCLVETEAAPTFAEPKSLCVPTNLGGMDYHSEACVNPGDRTCLVSNGSWSNGQYRVTCYGTPF